MAHVRTLLTDTTLTVTTWRSIYTLQRARLERRRETKWKTKRNSVIPCHELTTRQDTTAFCRGKPEGQCRAQQTGTYNLQSCLLVPYRPTALASDILQGTTMAPSS